MNIPSKPDEGGTFRSLIRQIQETDAAREPRPMATRPTGKRTLIVREFGRSNGAADDHAAAETATGRDGAARDGMPQRANPVTSEARQAPSARPQEVQQAAAAPSRGRAAAAKPRAAAGVPGRGPFLLAQRWL